jgi:hypothetical protein
MLDAARAIDDRLRAAGAATAFYAFGHTNVARDVPLRDGPAQSPLPQRGHLVDDAQGRATGVGRPPVLHRDRAWQRSAADRAAARLGAE